MPNLSRTFSSLKIPAFRFYLGGQITQLASMDMRTIALSLLIYRLTGSAALLGILSLVNAVPGILLPLFGGVVADRLHKKYTLIIGQVGLFISGLVIALALNLGYLSAERPGSWWIIMVVAFFNSGIGGLAAPSRQAIISELVGKDRIMNAISLSNMGRNIFRLGSPALAGFFIDAFGFASVYYFTASLNLTSGILTIFLPLSGKSERKGSNAFAQFKDGLNYIRQETTLLLVLVLSTSMVLLSWPYIRMLPIFVDDILKVGATGMGILISVSTIGGLVASLIMASIPSRKRGVLLLISGLVLGLALTGFAFSRNLYLSMAFLVLVGLGQSARMSLDNSILQSYADPKYQGRVMSLYTLEHGLSSLGPFIAGMMAGVVGVQWAVGSLAITLALIALLALVFLPKIRKIE